MLNQKNNNTCNNNCVFCTSKIRTVDIRNVLKTFPNQIWELEKIKEILKNERMWKTSQQIILPCNLDFRKDFFEILKYIKKWRFSKIILETNGRMFAYRDFCEDIIRCGTNEFFIYLHGHNAKIHDSITRVKGSFEQTVNSMDGFE